MYLPLLKAKAGELMALRTLPTARKKLLIPLLDIPRVQWDWVKGGPNKTLELHLEKLSKKIQKSWGTEYPLFIDFVDIDSALRMSDGSHPLLFMAKLLKNVEARSIYMLGPERDAAYTAAIQTLDRAGHTDFGIRVQRDDMEIPAEFQKQLLRLIGSISRPVSTLHLILDFRFLTTEDVERSATIAAEALKIVTGIGSFASVTLAASGFPEHLGGISKNAATMLERLEVPFWQRVRAGQPEGIQLGFGDYGIQHAELLDIDPRKMRGSANIRYSLTRNTLILKGRGLSFGFSQFHELSRQLVRRKEYSGSNYSWGDCYIAECAKRNSEPGNLPIWRAVGTSHHITLMTDNY